MIRHLWPAQWNAWGRFVEGRVASARRHKFGAIPVLVLDDGTLFTRADLEQLVAVKRIGLPKRRLTFEGLARHLGLPGFVMASKREATRWLELRQREREGLVCGLRRQVHYPLHVDGIQVGRYVADFVYEEGGQAIVEDCKGYRTPLYLGKRRHMEAEYGIQIRET